MEFERKTSNNEDENSSSNDETDAAATSPDDLRTYFIVVNDDGTLAYDRNRVGTESKFSPLFPTLFGRVQFLCSSFMSVV